MGWCESRASVGRGGCWRSAGRWLVALLGALLTAVSSSAGTGAGEEAAGDRAYFDRLVRRIEPEGRGDPERLPDYLAFFRREMIQDPRLFAFDVEAKLRDDGRVRLTGFAEFEENHRALVQFLCCLGFGHLDDRIEELPSAGLGPRRFGLVQVTHTSSFDRPGEGRQVVTDCLLGAPLYLLKESEEGFFLCHAAEGYVGYVAGGAIARMDAEGWARYQDGPRVYVHRDVALPAGGRVPVGARLKFVGRDGRGVRAELPGGCPVTIPAEACRVRGGQSASRVERVIQHVRRLLGTPYRWGGNTSEGMDCSGLVQVAFGAEGIHLARDSNQQVFAGLLVATRWHRQGLRPGDTLYFLGAHGKIRHTAIYVGGGRYVEAVRPVVRITSFDPEDPQYDARRSGAFAFGKRLLE